MTKLTYEEYIARAETRYIQTRNHEIPNARERRGQAYFNVLDWHRPDIAKEIRGDRNYDPYYLDHKLPIFLGKVRKLW